MSRQLVFSSTISVMVMAAFALSTTVKAQDGFSAVRAGQIVQVGAGGQSLTAHALLTSAINRS